MSYLCGIKIKVDKIILGTQGFYLPFLYCCNTVLYLVFIAF